MSRLLERRGDVAEDASARRDGSVCPGTQAVVTLSASKPGQLREVTSLVGDLRLGAA